jgi:hypothetical protein
MDLAMGSGAISFSRDVIFAMLCYRQSAEKLVKTPFSTKVRVFQGHPNLEKWKGRWRCLLGRGRSRGAWIACP